tara:strand:+ start:357 stop:659 length:303 start_codon:yes stop_codon:yes gene_type:complete
MMIELVLLLILIFTIIVLRHFFSKKERDKRRTWELREIPGLLLDYQNRGYIQMTNSEINFLLDMDSYVELNLDEKEISEKQRNRIAMLGNKYVGAKFKSK